MTLKNRKLDHINIMVPNLEQAVSYYTETLGFDLVSRYKNGMEFVFVSDGTITYELMEDKNLSAGVIDHIAYVSEDIQADYAHFEKLGLLTTGLGYIDFLFENGVYFFFIKGSANERIEFCQKK